MVDMLVHNRVTAPIGEEKNVFSNIQFRKYAKELMDGRKIKFIHSRKRGAYKIGDSSDPTINFIDLENSELSR